MTYEFIYEFMYMKNIVKSYLNSCVPRFQMQKAHSDGIIKLLLVMLRLRRVRARAGNIMIKVAMTVVNDGVMMLSEPDSSVFRSAFRLGFPIGEAGVTDRAPVGPNRAEIVGWGSIVKASRGPAS